MTIIRSRQQEAARGSDPFREPQNPHVARHVEGQLQWYPTTCASILKTATLDKSEPATDLTAHLRRTSQRTIRVQEPSRLMDHRQV
jgi:hypothetical protein